MLANLFQQIEASGLCALDAGHSVISFAAAPALLLYSYIPAIIVALLLSLLIFNSNRHDKLSKAFVFFTATYSLWVINIILQWILVPNKLLLISWQSTALLEVGFYISALYFLFSFCSQEAITKRMKILFSTLLSLIVILTPSILNIESYDSENCEGTIGTLWYIIYLFEIIVPIAILIYGFLISRKEKDVVRKKEIIFVSVALSICLGFFSASNISGEYLQVYSFNLFGPIGMLIFIGFVTYLIVKYKAFNTKLIAAQALVWGLVIVIGSEFFFIKTPINYVLTSITFIAVVVFGDLLIKSVKREIQQKEELAKLNIQLQTLIKQRESLVHLVTHKIKGSFTRSKYIFAGLLDGTFGEINDEVRRRAAQGLESDDTGINTVDLILNVANMQTGTVKYDMKKIDFKEIILKTFADKKVQAEAKGLQMESIIHDDPKDIYTVLGDVFWLREAVNNLIDNSIKYTKTGKITIGLEDGNGKVKFSIKDTGVGITDEDKKLLFTEGGRGKDSVKVNVDSTGYGLYSVKLIVDAHKGKVWAESEAGKGSTFFMELDAVNEK